MQAAADEIVLARAAAEGRVLISADTDFGGLLARSGATEPSVLLIRRLTGRRAAEQAAIIHANLDQVAEDLNAGAVVVLGDEWSASGLCRCKAARPVRSGLRSCRATYVPHAKVPRG